MGFQQDAVASCATHTPIDSVRETFNEKLISRNKVIN